jgi:hypothetical protein
MTHTSLCSKLLGCLHSEKLVSCKVKLQSLETVHEIFGVRD